jgi:uncharacterized spore protein YtfJ
MQDLYESLKDLVPDIVQTIQARERAERKR